MSRDLESNTERGACSQRTLPGWKRGFDVVGCIAGLPLLGALTLYLAVVTSVAARGPVFFRQEKIGHRGRRIWVYRFRTMQVDAAPRDWPKPREGEALIPGGGFLRATGLGELPQILNVLRREMSIVGPRPVSSKHLESMSPFLIDGLSSLPGLTGLSRLKAARAGEANDAVHQDIRYAATKSLGLDLKLAGAGVALFFRRMAWFVSAKLRGERLRSGLPGETVLLPSDSRRPW